MEGGDNDEDPGKKQKKPPTPSSRIDHTYVDYSTRQLSELLPPQALEDTEDGLKRKGRITFPMKLHDIVSNPKYRQVLKVIALTFMSSFVVDDVHSHFRHIISWMPHGRSWKILDKDLVASVICNECFSHQNFDSFNRSVNGWGFKVCLGRDTNARLT